MSVIFDAMLVLEMDDRNGIAALNRLLHEADAERHQQFAQIDMGGAGGSKFFTKPVYAAAFNHFIPEDVEECIRATPWRRPEWVLYVMDIGDYHLGDDERSLSARTVAEMIATA
jgi:hypothetical protein